MSLWHITVGGVSDTVGRAVWRLALSLNHKMSGEPKRSSAVLTLLFVVLVLIFLWRAPGEHGLAFRDFRIASR